MDESRALYLWGFVGQFLTEHGHEAAAKCALLAIDKHSSEDVMQMAAIMPDDIRAVFFTALKMRRTHGEPA